MARHCCGPIKQCHLDNISRLKMGDFGWYCKLMETWLSRRTKSLCGLQIATKLTVKRCIARKCANLYTSSSAIAAFYMIRLENAYGLLKALIALKNRFGTRHAGLFRMMVIWSFMINAQEIHAGLGLDSFQVEWQKEYSTWSIYCLTEHRLLYGSFNQSKKTISIYDMLHP